MKKIAVVNTTSLGTYSDLISILEDKIGKVSLINIDGEIESRELTRKLSSFSYIVTGPTPNFDSSFFENNKTLEFIMRFGIGYDNIDIESARSNGVIVSNIPSRIERNDVAELAVTLLVILAKNISTAKRAVTDGTWTKNRKNFLGIRLFGKTIGVVGFGSIGTRFSEIMKCGFGCKILVYDPLVTEKDVESIGAVKVSLDILLRESDIISLHCNLTEETKHIINRKSLANMKQDVLLINSARGGLIEEEALISALSSNMIGGYGADVSTIEPIDPSHPLLQFNNVLILPHIGASTIECNLEMCKQIVEDIISVSNGGKPSNEIKK